MQYAEGERDLVLLQHKFGIELADGTKQVRTSTLCEYGSTEPGGYTAIAKLGKLEHTIWLGRTRTYTKIVGIPCAVAVKQVLEGTLSEKGILAPMSSKINGPLIKELHEVGQHR